MSTTVNILTLSPFTAGPEYFRFFIFLLAQLVTAF